MVYSSNDACNKGYVDHAVQHVTTEDHEAVQLAVHSCADSALQARESQQASERFANEACSHADKARNSC